MTDMSSVGPVSGDGFGTRYKNNLPGMVELNEAETALLEASLANFNAAIAACHAEADRIEWLPWKISAWWALGTIGTGIWAYHDPAALLNFYVFVGFQIWFVGRAVTGR